MLRSGFLDRFLRHPEDRPALWVDRWITYGELRALGEQVAGWLADSGVRQGDRVCIQLDNGLALIMAHLGCMALGAVRVPLNSHYLAAELAPILQDADPALIITAHPERFEGWRVATEPGLGAPRGTWTDDGVTAWLFTSGTTGRPKGVPQTWTMWEHNLDALAACWALGADDQLWLCLPLFHTHGLVVGLHGVLLRGARAWISPRFDPVDPPAGTTHVYGVPTYYHRWLDHMAARPEVFRRLKLMVSGSDGMSRALSDEVFHLTGHRILERYGMTETVMLTSNPGIGERRAGTVGLPIGDVELRIVDGEVQVRGGSVFAGYHPRPDPTAFTEDGWFRTGDAGELDEAGYLRIVGRKKELVITGGVNVAPAEVEAILRGVPGVAEVGCCGLPDDDLVEVIGAAVVPDGSVPVDELEAALRGAAKGLSGLKRPRHYTFVASLPRNALGKLQRARIRDELFSPGTPSAAR